MSYFVLDSGGGQSNKTKIVIQVGNFLVTMTLGRIVYRLATSADLYLAGTKTYLALHFQATGHF